MNELKSLIESLVDGGKLVEARRLLNERLPLLDPDAKIYRYVHQQLALCTYKDSQLRPDIKFNRALTFLQKIGLNDP